jgi:Trk K+ transport system NAD-binding subunit
MRVAVMGTGMVGQAIAAKLSELGHEVTGSAGGT